MDESNDFDENKFCDQIDELYPPYIIAGMTINASRILKECDPIAMWEGYPGIIMNADQMRQEIKRFWANFGDDAAYYHFTRDRVINRR